MPRRSSARSWRRSAGGDGPELGGPVVVLDTAKGADGGSTYHVSASYLVPVDEDDPDLAGVSIAVPVTATVEIDGEGAIVGIDVPADPAAQRQARAFTRNLIARGRCQRAGGQRDPCDAVRASHPSDPRGDCRRIRSAGDPPDRIHAPRSAPPGPAMPEDAGK